MKETTQGREIASMTSKVMIGDGISDYTRQGSLKAAIAEVEGMKKFLR